MAYRRIGEFTPLGFLIGIVLCFALFWFVFVRLPFGTMPSASIPGGPSQGELERLSGKIENIQKQIDKVETRLGTLESAQESVARRPKKTGK